MISISNQIRKGVKFYLGISEKVKEKEAGRKEREGLINVKPGPTQQANQTARQANQTAQDVRTMANVSSG